MFTTVNGTRQGSIMSPALFSLYVDELLVELRKLGVGYKVAEVLHGAVGFCDSAMTSWPPQGMACSSCWTPASSSLLSTTSSSPLTPTLRRARLSVSLSAASQGQTEASQLDPGLAAAPLGGVCRTSWSCPATVWHHGVGYQDQEGQVHRQECGCEGDLWNWQPIRGAQGRL